MNGVYAAALELQRFLRKRRWKFCIIGGLAVARWGQPRTTQDVDISLLTGFGEEAKYIDGLLGQFKGRIPEAREFALENRVLLCQASNGTGLDIALAGLPFEEAVVSRATPFKFAARTSLVTASADDLVVLKAIADRDLDWFDIRGIVERQGKQLDWNLILRELQTLCELKEDDGPLHRVGAIRKEAEEGP